MKMKLVDYVLDHMLDYMIIGFVTIILQLLFPLAWAPTNKQLSKNFL